MNEMDLLTGMREEVPAAGVSAGAERAFFAGIRGEQTPPPIADRWSLRSPVWLQRAGTRRRRPGWRVAVAGGLCLALGTGAVTDAALRHSASRPAATGGAVLTVQLVAARAARAAAAGPEVSPHQWVYKKVLTVGLQAGVFTGWATADDTQWASHLRGDPHGKLYRGPWGPVMEPAVKVSGKIVLGGIAVPYRDLGSLPRDPATLDKYIGRLSPHVPSAYGWVVFEQISEMLTLYVMPPQITAEMYRAMALLPGLHVQRNAVDVAGRHGIGLTETDGRDATPELILDPHSYLLLGMNYGTGPDQSGGGMAFLRMAFVSGPGVRP